MTTPAAPELGLAASLVLLRQGIQGLWRRYQAAAPEGLSAEEGWLLLQLTAGQVSERQLRSQLAIFVDDAATLLDEALARQLIEVAPATSDSAGERRFLPGPVGLTFLTRLHPLAQEFNASWRGELFSQGTEREDLDLVLGMLQGNKPSGD